MADSGVLSVILESFETNCRRLFGFLSDEYGCTSTSLREPVRVLVYEICFSNSTTGIRVQLEYMEGLLYVFVCRVTDQTIAEIPIFTDASHSADAVFLDEIITLRNPRLAVEQVSGQTLTPKRIAELLSAYAKALRSCAEDALRGDLKVLDEVRRRPGIRR